LGLIGYDPSVVHKFFYAILTPVTMLKEPLLLFHNAYYFVDPLLVLLYLYITSGDSLTLLLLGVSLNLWPRLYYIVIASYDQGSIFEQDVDSRLLITSAFLNVHIRKQLIISAMTFPIASSCYIVVA
jgi:hypothetical protein